jgi:archaellum component FlaF (FlaF/FlaG flagellin family)
VKAISNIVATTLLIAFVIGVASLVGTFIPNIASLLTTETEAQSQEVIASATLRVEVEDARYDLTNDVVDVVAQNKGDPIESEFRLAAVCGDGSAVSKVVDADLSDGQILTDTLKGVECDVDRILLTSRDFPNVEDTLRDIQLVFSDTVVLDSPESFGSLAELKSNTVLYPLVLERQRRTKVESSSFAGSKSDVTVDGGALRLANK